MQRSKVGSAGKRMELYRMQTPNANESPEGGVIIQYELQPPHGRPFSERVDLINGKDGWRPAGYGFQPVATGSVTAVSARARKNGRTGESNPPTAPLRRL
jgi:hypothetical protein